MSGRDNGVYGRRLGNRLANKKDASHVLWPRLSPVKEGSCKVMETALVVVVAGISNVRDTEGMAVLRQ